MSALKTCPICKRNERMEEGAASCTRCQLEYRTEGDLLAGADAELEAIGTASSSWEPIDLGPVLDGSEIGTPPTMLERTDGQCLLYPSKLHLLYGEPEAGKDWLNYRAAAGRIAKGERVLFYDFETDKHEAVSRLRALGVPDLLILKLFCYSRPDEALRGPIRETAPTGASLAIISGWTEALSLFGYSFNDGGDIAKFIAQVARPLADLGAAVAITDHVVKSHDERGRWAIGSQHKLAAVDVGYMLEPKVPFGRGMHGASRLTLTKDRPGYLRASCSGGRLVGEVHLESGEGGKVQVRIEPGLAESDDGLSVPQQLVADVLTTEPQTVRQIGDATATSGHPLKRMTIVRALEALADMGLADGEQLGTGRAGTWWLTKR